MKKYLLMKSKIPTYLKYYLSKTRLNVLPKEYQEVEYIESTATQYIDTGYVPNQNTSVDIKFVKHSNTFVFGSRTSLSLNSFGIALLQDGFRSDYGSSNIICQRSFSEPIILNVDKNKVYVYNSLEITHEQQVFTSPGNLYLFGINNNNNILYGSHSIYYCKIYDNGTLVRDMIPCYRKNDNVVGMYDTVNNVFYTNAGTGTFEVGNNKLYKQIIK